VTPPQEIRFGDILPPEHLCCELAARTPLQAIVELIQLLHGQMNNIDPDTAAEAVLAREHVSSTVIAPGLAVPHARLDGLTSPRVAVGTSSQGIDFHAPGDEPVRIVVLVLTPKADPSAYLRVLAGISKALGTADARKRLLVAHSPADMRAVLTESVDHLPAYLDAADVMNVNPVVVLESDTLAEAIHILCRFGAMDVPVVDEDRDLRGVISMEDILHLSLPPHLLWMDDLSSISNFEPFTELLQKDMDTKVADFMREEYVYVAPDTPAIQLAKLFLINETRCILVVDQGRLAGLVSIERFVGQLFWA
jgi:mannitol/fructose-specific phosphotransferase system IIA component (Ntr-type)/predicted transcriptional regulator